MYDTINTDTTTASRLVSRVLSASTLSSDDVYNPKGDKLGSIKELMLDIENGKVCYVVLSFGGFLSLGEKLFAVPWSALKVDTENKRFVMDTDEVLEATMDSALTTASTCLKILVLSS